MDDIHCGLYSLTFESGSVTASVNISLVNDDVPECDETFTAYIILGEGFRAGANPSTLITVMDEGNNYCDVSNGPILELLVY